ncbi:MAG: alpha/beta hydrolase [Candidatus Binatia bacterium]
MIRLLNAVVRSGRYVQASDVSFGADGRMRLDVYRSRRAAAPAPIVVFFYGGSWQRGERADYAFVGEALASRGIVTVIADYRIYPPHGFPSFLEDGALAVRWAREHAHEIGGDPGRLFVMGHSAGAHIAAMLAVDRRYLKTVDLDGEMLRGVIGLAGPYDFLPLKDPVLKALFGPEDGLPTTQPVTFVDGAEPPMLLLHGKADRTVGPRNSRRLAARIRERGGAVDEIVYEGVGHVGILLALAAPFRFWAPVLDDTVRFVRERSGLS